VSDYTGFVITLRRASDDTKMSFYSTMSGQLSSETGISAATFLEDTVGYVEVWFDQSGKGNDAYQTDTSRQPIVDLTKNCLDFALNSATSYLNMPSGTVPVGVVNAPYSFIVKYGLSSFSYKGGMISAGARRENESNMFDLTNSGYDMDWFFTYFSWSRTDANVPAVAAVAYDGIRYLYFLRHCHHLI
jgi:hypothetical protein